MPARVLVVDDIPSNIRLLEAKLQAEYYEVLTALDGKSALAAVAEHQPDIVLLDVMMPGMDGFEVCRRLKADPTTAHVPVVMVTALSDARDRVRGLEAGADDFLTKPPNTVAMLARIRSLVRLKRAIDEWHTREAAAAAFGAASFIRADLRETGDILVAEETLGGQSRTVEALRAVGHEVVEARSRADAIRIAAERRFDMFLVDHRIGDDDGLRLCSWLRSYEMTRRTPILLVIEDGEAERLAKALDLGVNDYLVKPPDRDELIARTRTQLRRKQFEEALRVNYRRNLAAAMTDPLTGLYNRRYFETHFEIVSDRLAASGKPISLMIFDIDRFKDVNDRYGHAAGDKVLKGVASLLCDRLRGFDTAARLGGEEFVVLLPEAEVGEAMGAGMRIARAVAGTGWPIDGADQTISVTVSAGVAAAPAGSCDYHDLLARADEALYDAKHAGRNRVCAAANPAPAPVHRAAG